MNFSSLKIITGFKHPTDAYDLIEDYTCVAWLSIQTITWAQTSFNQSHRFIIIDRVSIFSLLINKLSNYWNSQLNHICSIKYWSEKEYKQVEKEYKQVSGLGKLNPGN